MKHDEKKKREIMEKYHRNDWNTEQLIMEYAEHMVQQERERIVNIITGLSLSSWLLSINNDYLNVEQAEGFADSMEEQVIKAINKE